jgi:putative nucleotidyltransferase with HDIG domain
MLSLEKAQEILHKHVTEPHLLTHALAVSSAMGALAEHFGEDIEYWRAIGYLHDVDFEKFPEEHLQHARELLEPEGLAEADIRAILSHGWGLCYDVKPISNLEKSLYAVDELTGIVMATALMRPTGIADLEVKSVNKKFKDKRFAAKCNRDVIRAGCELLGLELDQLMALTIKGMQGEAVGLGFEV